MNPPPKTVSYGEAILHGFTHLLEKHSDVFIIGQGLWSPWYVGNSMTDLDKKFGTKRIIDSPVSEAACTGIAIGASLCGYRPVVVHPRVDFMILAIDQIVNQAAKWHHMLGGKVSPAVTIRGIVNRGGEQGAQHSQALHSWFAHIPGLRVVVPATAKDARDLLVASVLSPDPVVYIDDRWLYDVNDDLGPVEELDLATVGPEVRQRGDDVTLVGASYAFQQCMEAAQQLKQHDISAEVIDLRVLNPFRAEVIIESVRKTRRLCVVDGGWLNCGMAGEVIARVVEKVEPNMLRAKPVRITLPDAPAPTSKPLEDIYYPKVNEIVNSVRGMFTD